MDSSFIQSQHPVVEELLTNKYFGDTLLVCANGHLTDNKLAVGLLFPALLTSDIFALPIENVLLVPDYTMEEIGREFEKLILGGSFHTKPSDQQQSTTTTTSTSSSTSTSQHSTTTVVDSQSQETSASTSESSSQSQVQESQSTEIQSTASEHGDQHIPENGSQHQQGSAPAYMSPVSKSDARRQGTVTYNTTWVNPGVDDWYDRRNEQQTSVQLASVQTVQSASHLSSHPQQHRPQASNTANMMHGTVPHLQNQVVHPQGVATLPQIQAMPSPAPLSQSVPPSPLHHSVPPSPAPHQVIPASPVINQHLLPASPAQSAQLVPASPLTATHQQVVQAATHQHQQHVMQATQAPHQQVVQASPAPHQQIVQASPAPHQQQPAYTTQYRVVPNTIGQYSTNNTVPFTPQPYTNSLQYQELSTVQPVISVQSVQPVSSVQQALNVSSGNLVSTDQRSLSYTNLGYHHHQDHQQDQDYSITDLEDHQDDDTMLDTDENITIYREKEIEMQEVTLRNGFPDDCEVVDAQSNISVEKKDMESNSRSAQASHSKKKSVTFKEPDKTKSQRGRKAKVKTDESENTHGASSRPPPPLLKIEECEDQNVQMIENIKDKESPVLEERRPGRPRSNPESPPVLEDRRSGRTRSTPESPILEDRRPGRPRSKPQAPSSKPVEPGGITRFKRLSAQDVTKGKYKCTECKKILSCQSSLNRHMLVHTDGKPFKCKYCSKAFRENSKKLVHERVHTGSKPFPCKFCNQSFRTATQRRVHMFRHTKESPWICEVCNHKFPQKFNLTKHKEKRNH